MHQTGPDRSYSGLILLPTYKERLDYLKLKGGNHESPRLMSLSFFSSSIWRKTKQDIKIRDMGCDLGVFGMYIYGPILVHHIDPITEEDILNFHPKLIDPENLITVSFKTHGIIHYLKKEEDEYIERSPNDTRLW